MAEDPKPTSGSSSSEDAAFFRKFRSHVLSSLVQGMPRERLKQDLVAQGVPTKTAERIVIAGEHEATARAPQGKLSPGKRRTVLAFAATVFLASAGYIVWRMAKDQTLSLKALIPGLVMVVLLGAAVCSRLLVRGKLPYDLPEPPKPPRP